MWVGFWFFVGGLVIHGTIVMMDDDGTIIDDGAMLV